jgi:branched-subunit amino acid aminotransferase/4-amino-4-deoxychorismate lyase
MAELNGRPATVTELETLALANFGHFTSMRVDDGTVRGLALHMERLVRDCQKVFAADLDAGSVLDYVRHATRGRVGSYTVRVTIFDPKIDLGNVGDQVEPQVLVTIRSAGAMPSPPLTIKTYPFTRDTAEVKHIGLFGQLRCRRAAKLAGFDDAIFTEADGRLSEGATWNLGFVRDEGEVIWPDAPVLPGVTMQLLQQEHAHTVGPVKLTDLGEMRAAFATNTSIGVRAIRRINDIDLPTDNPTCSTLQKIYADLPGDLL